jgi:hypothetical protein
MCQFKSAIVLKDKIVCPLDVDSHSTILESLGIADNNEFPNFVRIEMTPKDGDVFNHDLANWELEVDQDFKPDWFDPAKAEEHMKKYHMPEVFERFIIDREVQEIKEGRWYMKNGIIRNLSGTAIIEQMWGNSQVNVMRESSQVKEMWGNSQVKEMWGNSQVKEMWESSQVKEMWGNSQVNVMWGNSQVKEMWGNSQVNVMWGNSQVKEMWGNSTARKYSYNEKTKLFIPKGAFEVVEVEEPKEE